MPAWLSQLFSSQIMEYTSAVRYSLLSNQTLFYECVTGYQIKYMMMSDKYLPTQALLQLTIKCIHINFNSSMEIPSSLVILYNAFFITG
jgi:hypothetical protein